PTSLWEAFAATAQAHAAEPALLLPDRKVSYGELAALASRCAAHLNARGVRRGSVVALQLPKRLEAYALLLGCLQLGAPYVFIDPKNPADRTARMLERLHPALMITTAQRSEAPCATIELPSEERGRAWLASLSDGAAEPGTVTAADPAYIMFTSGSTGEP